MKANVLMAAVPVLLLAACGQDTYPDDLSYSVDPEPQMIAVGNVVFMRSPYGDTVVKVTPAEQTGTAEEDAYTDLRGSTIEYIGVGEAPGDLVATPDGRYVLSLVRQGDSGGLAVISPSAKCSGDQPVDASCVKILEGRALHDTLTLSPDGRYAVSSISPQAAASSTEDIINLNEIGIYDLSDLTVRFATVGYNPGGFAFTHGDEQRRMVVITESKVVVVDLETGDMTSRDLSLSGSTTYHPNGVVVTGNDHFALVTMDGSSDLFTFDLSQASLPINILNLGGTPRAMQLSATGNEALVLYTNSRQLGVIHQEDLSVDLFTLDSSVSKMLSPDGTRYAVFYDTTGGGRQLYYLDLETERLDTYPLDNTCVRVEASPAGDVLVLFYNASTYTSGQNLSTNYAVAILNLGQGDRAPTPIAVRSLPVGAAFYVGADPSLDEVYVPFEGTDSGTVGRFNLSSYESLAIDVAPSPYAIAMLSDGRIVTAHTSPLGFLSVFPRTNPDLVQFVRGFLTDGLL